MSASRKELDSLHIITSGLSLVADEKEEKDSPIAPDLSHLTELESIPRRAEGLMAVDLRSLQPGDILLYLPKPNMSLSHQAISCNQLCIRMKTGDNGIVHAGIFYGYSGTHVPMIAHLIKAGFKISKLKEDQPLLVFRAHSEAFAAAIKHELDLLQSKKIKWTFSAGCSALMWRKKSDPSRPIIKDKNEISSKSICSQLVAEVIESAVHSDENNKPYRLNKARRMTPKDLESELFQNHNYSMLFYLGNKLTHTPLQIIETAINAEIVKGDAIYPAHFIANAKMELAGAKMRLSVLPHYDNLTQALYLYNSMREHLDYHASCVRPSPAKELARVASKIGLFKTVLNRYKQDAAPDNDAANLDRYAMNTGFRI